MAQELAALRLGAGTTISPSANFAPPPVNSDVTLGPGAAGAGAFYPPAQAVTVDQTGRPVQTPTPKKPAKSFETLFGTALLSVAGLAAVIAGGWYWYTHRNPPEPPHQVVTIPSPGPQQNPPQTLPQTQPGGPTTPAPVTGPVTTPVAAPTKPGPGSPKSAKPSAGKPTSAKTTTAPPQPVAVVTPPPAPATKPDAANPTPAKTQPAPSASSAFDPRKADPNKNGKLKIDVSKFPKGLPFTVSMNNKSYIHFITGDGTSLDNLYAPPGMQQFQVSFKSGGQEWDSKPLSSDFKVKKGKTLKVQLLENGKADSKITVPISKDAVLSISFNTSLSDLF